jgi:hypothetical protein
VFPEQVAIAPEGRTGVGWPQVAGSDANEVAAFEADLADDPPVGDDVPVPAGALPS